MKIVCEACQAKYSISDDKVRGKAFKIRCKKCSHIIVVRSGEGSSSAQLPVQSDGPRTTGSVPAAAASTENSWHIVVEGEQVGPLSASDVRARLARGEISGDTYIWREGLADWLKVSSVPEFSDGGAPEEDAGTPFPTTAPTTVYPPGTAESAFAASPSADSDVFAAPTTISAPKGADLFASPAAAPEPAPTPAPSFSFGAASEPAPRHTGNGASAGGGLTGQRHENSVLFSLSNLEALAAPAAPASMAPRPGSSGPSEGSGLIDIRSMAQMTLNQQEPGRISNDLPTFGAPQFAPMAPVLLPIGAPSGPPKWIIGVIIGGVAAAAAIAVLTFMVIKSDDAAKAPVAATTPPPAAPTPPPAAATPPPAAAPAAPPATPPASATEELPPRDKPAAVAETGKKGAKKPARGGKPSRGGEASSAAPPVVASAPAAAPSRAPAAQPNVGKGDALDDLLKSAIGSKGTSSAGRADDEAPARRPAAAAPSGGGSLPNLEKSDIVRALVPINAKVKACYNQYKVPGTAMVAIKLARGGRVSDANVSGKFAGTPTGACVENAVKDAKFPPTEAQTVNYPFPLH